MDLLGSDGGKSPLLATLARDFSGIFGFVTLLLIQTTAFAQGAPKITIGAPSATVARSSTTVAYAVTYTGASTINLSLADISLVTTSLASAGGPTATVTISGSSGSTRTVMLSNFAGNGTLGISIKAGTAVNTSGSTPAVVASKKILVDTTPPGVSIGTPKNLHARETSIVEFPVNFSGANSISLSDLTKHKISVKTLSGNATAQVSVTGSGPVSRIVRLSNLSGNGSLSISIAAGTATDAAGNPASASPDSPPVIVDNTAPTISVGAPSQGDAKGTSTVSYTITYTGASSVSLNAKHITFNKTGPVAGDLPYAKVTITGTGSTSRTITLSGFKGNGTLGITLAEGTARDAAGNVAPAPATPIAPFSVDTTPPSMAVSGPTPAHARASSTVTYTVNYTGASAVTLSVADITLTKTKTANATATVAGSGTTNRTITLSSFSGDGTIALSIAAGTAVDAAGNPAAALVIKSVVNVDTTPPQIVISAPSRALTPGGQASSVSYTVNFSGISGINLTGGATRTNRVRSSSNFADLSVRSNDGVTFLPNNITAPDGTNTATKLVELTNNGGHWVTAGGTGEYLTGTYTFSVYMKAAGRRYAVMSQDISSAGGTFPGQAFFDLVNGTVVSSSSATASVTDAGDGWYRCSITSTASNVQGGAYVALSADGTSTQYQGDGSNGIYIWGSQLELASTPGPYIPSGATFGTGAGDIAFTTTGDAAAGLVTVTPKSANTVTVTISDLSGNGTIGISLAPGAGVDLAGNKTARATSGATFTVDSAPPTLTIGEPVLQVSSLPATLSYDVTYSGASKITLGAAHVSLITPGTAAAGLVSVKSTGANTRTVSLSGFTGSGNLGIRIAAGTATDTAGNLANGADSGTTAIGLPSGATEITVSSVNLASTVTEGRVLHLDAGNPRSYPGSGTTWLDLSGLGNNGTLVNGPGFNSTIGGNFTFDGINDHATVANYSLVNLNHGTIAAWVKYDDITTNEVVVSYGGNATDQGFLLQNENAVSRKIGFYTYRGTFPAGSTYAGGTVSLTHQGKWIYQVGTYTTTSTGLYLNGDLVETKSIAATPITARDNLWIGSEPGRSYFLNGSVAMVQVYNRALSANEILQNYLATRHRFTTAPVNTDLALASPSGNATIGAQSNLDFVLTTSVMVTVTGTPTINFKIGGVTKTATYVGGGGTRHLIFRYTTAHGDDGAISWDAGTVNGGSFTHWSSPLSPFNRAFGAGNSSRSVDSTPPENPTLSESSQKFSSSSLVVTVTPGNLVDTTFKEFRYVTVAGTTPAEIADCASGTALPSGGTITISAPVTTVTVLACDSAGNFSSSRTAIYEYEAPPTTAPNLGSPVRSVSTLSLTWSSVPNASGYSLYWSTTSPVTTASQVITDVTPTYPHPLLQGGTRYYYRVAPTRNGFTGPLSNEVSAIPYSGPAPTVSSISPASGSSNGGTAVTITGTGFNSGASVLVGGTLATGVTVVSDTSLTAVMPQGTAGMADVVVRNTDLQEGTLALGFNYVAAYATQGLVLHVDASSSTSYPGSGTTWYDLSGNNNHMTLNPSNSLPAYTAPGTGAASAGYFRWNGSSQSAATSNAINLTTGGTLSVWFRKNGNWESAYQKLIACTAGNTTGYPFMISQGPGSTFYSYLQTPGQDYGADLFTLGYPMPAVDSWHNATATYNGSKLLLYVDGTLKAEAAATGNFRTQQPCRLAWSYNSEYFAGDISMAMIYNRALSQSEVTQNFLATARKFGTGLIVDLDAGNPQSYPGTGTTWYDVSGNGNNATLENGATYSSAGGGSIAFDGPSDQATIAANARFAHAGDFAVEIWTKLNTYSLDDCASVPWSTGGSGSIDQIWVGHTSGCSGFSQPGSIYGGGSSSALAPPGSVKLGWNHIVFTRIASTLTAYVNGVAVGANSLTTTFGRNGIMRIGRRTDDYHALNGNVAALRVYRDMGLNASQVQANYEASRARYGLATLTPAVISGLQLWLDAADAATLQQDSGGTAVTTDGAAVGYWLDKSGNNRHATQTDQAKRPVLKLTTQHGKSVLRFDGTNDLLGLPAGNYGNNMTVFVVYKWTAPSVSGNAGYLYAFGGATSPRQKLNAMYMNGSQPVYYFGERMNTAAIASTLKDIFLLNATSFESPYATSNLKTYNNGVSLGTTAFGQIGWGGGATNDNVIGADKIDNGIQWFTGDMAEIVVYNSVLTAEQRQSIEAWLNRKWSVY